MRGPMAAPGARLALEAAAGSVALGLVTVCLLWAVSLVEGQAGLPPLLAARLVAPLCAAAAIAGAVASSRNTGRWDSWASLGVSPSRQLLPLLAVVLVGALLLPGPWHAAPSELSTLRCENICNWLCNVFCVLCHVARRPC